MSRMKKRKLKVPNPIQTLIGGLQNCLAADLTTIRAGVGHSSTKGSASEGSWIRILSRILPSRYSCSRGIIVDSKGRTSDQIDIVVYDRNYSAMIFQDADAMLIPIEAVAAIFEIKQSVDSTNLKYASDKAASISPLKATSAAIPQLNGRKIKKKPIPPITGLLGVDFGYQSLTSVAFKKAFKDSELNVVFCASGQFITKDAFNKGNSQPALVRLFFWLNDSLQKRGNPPALDYIAYLPKS